MCPALQMQKSAFPLLPDTFLGGCHAHVGAQSLCNHAGLRLRTYTVLSQVRPSEDMGCPSTLSACPAMLTHTHTHISHNPQSRPEKLRCKCNSICYPLESHS